MKKFLGPLLTAGTLLALLYTVYGYREQNEKLKSERDGLTKPMGGGNNQNNCPNQFLPSFLSTKSGLWLAKW